MERKSRRKMKKRTKKEKLYCALNYFYDEFIDLNKFQNDITEDELKQDKIKIKKYKNFFKYCKFNNTTAQRYYKIISNIIDKMEK
jgi:hypothetical protein